DEVRGNRMAYFEGILPQDRTATPTPKVAPGLLALLNGTPIAGDMGAQLAAQPGAMGPVGTPAPAAPPSAPPPPAPAPSPELPTAPVPGLPLPDPVTAGFEVAARGAQAGQVFDSPIASLASSVLRSI